MKNTIVKMLCLWLCVMLLGVLGVVFVFSTNASQFQNNSQVQAYQNKISGLKEEQAELKDRLADVQNERYTAQQQANDIGKLIASTSELITTTEALIADLDVRIAEKERQIADTEEKIVIKEGEIEDTRRKFLDFVCAQYMNGTPTILEILYDSDGITDLLSRVQYNGSIMDYNTRLLDTFTTQKGELEVLLEEEKTQKAELEEEKTLQEQYKEELVATKAELEYQKGVQDDLVASLAMTEEEILAEYNAAVEAEKQENARLEALLAKLAAESKGSYVGGALDWPVSKNIKYISSYYGNRTYYYMGRKVSDFHMGIDIPAGVGTDIYAAQSGKVILAQWHYSYGNYMIVDHGGGITTLYAHCTKLLKGVGTYVEKGEHIAEMGSTGNSTGSHLHFEVRVNGKHTNPLGSYKSPTGEAWVVQPK